MNIEITKNNASTVYINTPETSFATFIYTQKGDLFLHSDWGNYVYSWGSFGDDFEKFLKGLEIGYLFTKMESGFNQYPVVGRRAEVLMKLLELFLNTLTNQTPEPSQPNNIIEIKGELLDTHDNYESWLKTVTNYPQRFGFNKKIIHVNKNGFNTTGYDLKNFEDEDVFPVKSYLLTQSTPEPTPFKSISNN